MSFDILIKGSRFIKILRSGHFWLIDIYINSHTYKLINRFKEIIKSGFRYSFLSRIYALDMEINTLIMQESRFVNFWIKLFTAARQRLVNYLKTDQIFGWINCPGEDLQILIGPKDVGLIIALTILVNIPLSYLFNVRIGLLGWIIRFVFLLLGISGLFCNADWQDIRKTSFIFRQPKQGEN